jgi:hypothetical protein
MNIQIYKDAHKLCLFVCKISNSFPKDYKYCFGEKLKNISLDLILQISDANNSNDKEIHIVEIINIVKKIEIIFRLLVDLKIISLSQHSEIVLLTAGMLKQSNGWLKSKLQ